LLKNKIERVVSPAPSSGETHLSSNFRATLLNIPFIINRIGRFIGVHASTMLSTSLCSSVVFFFLLFFNSSLAAKHKCLSGDCRNGKGTASYPKGDVYNGDWRHGLAEGKGVLEYVNGNVYIGEWKDGYATGKGMMRFSNGNLYQGDWIGSQADGFGVLYDKFGNVIFSGIWKEGKFISKLLP